MLASQPERREGSVLVDFAALRRREYARLDASQHAYLDYTGAALYPERLVTAHADMLRNNILGNPHAENPASLASSAIINDARSHLLGFLDADPSVYCVVFTANATSALNLVAQGFQFGRGAPLVLTMDNHNSVNGMREYATRCNAPIHYLPLDDELRPDTPEGRLAELYRPSERGLLAFPAQSNFSGVKHPLSLVRFAQTLGHRVVLDAAALLPMTRLSLRSVPADFVALSFYKMFGYPTGIGALVARRDALAELRRPWFSGGTVDFVSVQNGVHSLRAGEEGFEDGTANFHGIAAVSAGLNYLETVGLPNIEQHTASLTLRLIDTLTKAEHQNGEPLACVYGPLSGEDRGATVAFNLLDDSGAVVPYAQVEQRAREARVSIRGGCFCNPGASEAAFRFPVEQTARCLAATASSGWSIPRFAECMHGHAVGALRASFGLPSNDDDLQRLLDVVSSFAH